MNNIKTLLNISGKHLKDLWKTAVFSFAEVIFIIIPYLMVLRTLQTIKPETDDYMFEAVLTFAAMLLCMFLRFLFRWKAYYNIQICGVSFSTDLRKEIGDHYKKLSLGYFNGKDLGELSGEMLKSIIDVENIVTQSLSNTAVLLSGLIMFLLGLVLIDYKLGLTVIGVIILAIPFIALSTKMAKKYGVKSKKAAFDTSDKILEYVYGIKTIKSYNLGLGQLNKTKDALVKQYRASMQTEIKVAPLVQSFGMIVDMALPIGMIVALYLINSDTIDSTRVLSFFISAPRIFTMTFLLSVMFTEIRLGLNSVDSLSKVLKQPILADNGIKLKDNLDIEFDQVNFSYLDKPVLNDISFKIQKGSFTAIVGPSGSGKTTIANLIARFWDIDQGVISIGGINIKKIPADELLSKISMVFQNVFLFNETLYNNVTLGDNDKYTEQEVYKAIADAQMDDFVRNLPKGYKTMVGESGATLSGGERQRVAVARALLKDAPILILDEATASLDAENEHLIQMAFNNVTKNKTLIVIAHRLATIVDADQIIVLTKDGNLAEIGTHEELVKNDGQYTKLWEAQEEIIGWHV